MINDFRNIDSYQLAEEYAEFLKHYPHSEEEKENFRDLTVELATRFVENMGVLHRWTDDNPIEVIPKGQNRVSKYDIVIHCNSQDEHDEIEKALECFFSADLIRTIISEIEKLYGAYCGSIVDIGRAEVWDNAIDEALKIIHNHVDCTLEDQE